MHRASFFAVLSLALPACLGETKEPFTPATVDGGRAWKDLEHLVQMGPRRIDTPQSVETRAYIKAQLEPLGWVFEEDTFEATPPAESQRQGTVTGTNLLAHLKGTQPGNLWFASHYDTFDRPRFVGANDAGSSTALLIELGRQLACNEPREGYGITLCWFDGEEPFYPVRWDDHSNSTFGSRHLADKMEAEGTLKDIRALILLDMVGDRQLGLTIESMSSGWIRSAFERTASALGHKQLFVDRREIKDDHLPFIKKGVPAADLIDFRFGPGNSWWHTNEDTLDKCSQTSLQIVGDVVLSAVPVLERAAQARER
ncbi:MAG: M28 family peptidase [Planctomycetes bacterium]|nr:M28 family peptidase [Planctomycetota bacterium]